jgi:predicted fused transcriptional regulator/phosphomethylpyrimidine kinase
MGRDNLFEVKFDEKEIEINGDKYFVREMNAKDASEYESSLYKQVGNTIQYVTKNAKEKLVIKTLYDSEGRVFKESDIELVGKLPASVVDKIFQVASKLNGLESEEVEKN